MAPIFRYPLLSWRKCEGMEINWIVASATYLYLAPPTLQHQLALNGLLTYLWKQLICCM